MRASLVLAVALCGAQCACRGTQSRPIAEVDASRSSAAPSKATADAHGPSREPSKEIVPCRAIAVDGDVRVETDDDAGLDGGERRLSTQDRIADGEWLTLAPAARVVLKDPHSLRETAFVGPGRARGCVNGQGESWLRAGRFEGALGGAEAPLAEQWVVTPFGVFRYVSAKIDVDVTSNGATAWIGGGTCFFWSADDARVEKPTEGRQAGATDAVDAPWQRVTSGVVHIVPSGSAAPGLAAEHAIDSCSVRATHAEQLARLLLTRDAGPAPTGETVAEQVRARRIAHASCGVARLRLELLPPTVAREPMAKMLDEADEAWSRLPLR